MKLEMGESLMLSWLKHIKNCKIAQLNWKPSKLWKQIDVTRVENLYAEMQKEFNFDDISIFSSPCSKTLCQAELDVLGLDIDNNIYYAIDVAYHEQGLRYGADAKNTTARVTKKMLRSVLILMAFFHAKSGNIIFACPKIQNKDYVLLQDAFDRMNKFVKRHELQFNIQLICNEDFTNQIINPIVKKINDVADTGELFVRAVQLFQLGSGIKVGVLDK